MKIIINESQFKKLVGENIKCKCGHSWKNEKNDKQPYLCHICGWDHKSRKYNDDELFNFWKNYKD